MRDSAAPTLFVALMLAAACSGHNNGTSPSQPAVSNAQIESDVAMAAAGEIASDIADYSSADTGGGGALVPTSQPSAARARTTPRTVRIRTTCTPSTAPFQLVYAGGSDTLSIALTWNYFGSDGCESTFSPTLTDSIAYTSVDSLAVNGSGWIEHSVVDRAYSVDGSGASSLASDTVHVWSGVGQGVDTSTYTGSPTSRSYTGVAYDTTVAITFAHPRNGDAFPQSGTASLWYAWTLTVTGTGAETATVTGHVVATLNGTNDVPLQVLNPSTGTLELSCILDLTAHRVVANSCH
jgi:hypothetical protein